MWSNITLHTYRYEMGVKISVVLFCMQGSSTYFWLTTSSNFIVQMIPTKASSP